MVVWEKSAETKYCSKTGKKVCYSTSDYLTKNDCLYFEEYLNPRSGSGLLDLISLDLIPRFKEFIGPILSRRIMACFQTIPSFSKKITHIDGFTMNARSF